MSRASMLAAAILAASVSFGSAAAEDLAALSGALRGLDGFFNRGVRAEVTETMGVSGDEFWPAPLPGSVRRWITNPVAVPETVRQRRGTGAGGSSQRWTLSDAVRVSVGLVWRDLIAGERTSSRWFEEIAAATREHGVEVHDAQLLNVSDVSPWVHKTPKQMVVQPYRATVSLGRLATDRTLVAIGQSRHLGGGLLVPVDSPADSFLTACRGPR
jgi:CRISPR-associated protein Csb2